MKKFLILLLLGLVSQASAAPQQATFAAGCYWCMEALFEGLPGVTNVVSGFSGGHTENPTYALVGREDTGHAEAIDVTFDPEKISYERLLWVFFASHDPTNGKGVAPDFGDSYRPILFYRNDEQKAAIEKVKAEVQKTVSKPIATEILPFKKFWPAMESHQNYVKNNPDDSYVKNVSIPRIQETLKKLHSENPAQ